MRNCLLCAILVALCCAPALGLQNCQRYGVVHGADSTTVYLMSNLGANYVRVVCDWDMIEAYGDNNYDWGIIAGLDNFVATVNAAGCHVYYGFNYTPAWARPGGTGNNTPPTDPSRYTDFITFMVNRYKDTIKDWGFWNETNLSGFWNSTQDNYIHNFLLPGIDAVKAVDPTARCVVGEFATFGNDVATLQNVLQHVDAAGKHNLVDVVCTHAYGNGDTAAGRLGHMDAVHTMMVGEGWSDKDFWCTETSFWNGSEANQSTQVMAFMQGMDARRAWWKKTFYFTLCEGALGDGGLVRPDLTPTLAYTNLAAYTAAHLADQWTYGNGGASWAIPGTIQGENYDDGCEGVSYHDSDAISSGAAYRTEAVDVEPCAEGGYDIGWINNSEWLEYTVNVAANETYSVGVRVAAPSAGGSFHIEMNGTNVTGSCSVPSTGGFQNWTTVTVPYVALSAGTQIMRVVFDTGGYNLNYVTFSPAPPANVTSFVATSGDTQNSLSWHNPSDSDFSGTKIMFKTTGYPTGPTDGTQVCNKTNTPNSNDSFVHTGLTNGTTYYYKAFAYDTSLNYASGTQVSAIPADVVAPGNVTSLTATAANAQNNVSWIKPGDSDLAGVKIMFKTTGYPTGPADGTQCYIGTGTSFIHTGLTNGTAYYYKAFAYDEVPNYSSGVTATATPAAGFCWEDHFTYGNGALNGNGGWSGTATSAHIAVTGNTLQILGGAGSYSATRTVSCGVDGQGIIKLLCNVLGGSGASTMWSLWINDSTGKNFGRWYGTGTTARGRIGDTGLVTSTQTLRGGGLWDSLVVIITPSAQTAQFYCNGGLLGTLNYSSQGTGSSIGQVRFERIDNSGAAGNYLYFDDPRIAGG